MKALRVRWLLVVIAAIPLLAGCGAGLGTAPSAQKAKTPQVPVSHEPPRLDEGWSLATIRSDGFAIGLPPGWTKFDLGQADWQGALSQMRDANPNLANALTGQVASMVSQGVKLFAVDQNQDFASTGFATNLNVVKTEIPDGMDLDQLSQKSIDEMKKQIQTTEPLQVFKNRLNLNSGEAIRIQYTLTLNVPGGKSLAASLTQYLAINGGYQYIVTCTTTDAQFPQYAELFDRTAKTLTFLGDN